MRVLGFCLTVWLGLIGYQAEATSIGEEILLVEDLQPSHHVAWNGGRGEANGGVAGDMVNCWTHASCSPACMVAIEDARSTPPSLVRRSGRGVIYDSLALPPTAPPPRV